MSRPLPQLICRVEDTFVIPRRGLVLCPDAEVPEGVTIRRGDPVELRTPDSRTTQTRIRAIEILTPNPKRILPMILEAPLTKDDVPVGSEIWTRPRAIDEPQRSL